MNIILLLKELWQKRRLVAGAAGFAVLVAAVLVYDVSLFPPSLSKQDHHEARGSMEILVDSAVSPIGDVRRQLTPLSERAGIFARYVAGGEVVTDIAKETGIPAKQIQVAGPIAVPGAAPGSEEPAPFIHPYGIEIAQHATLPILDVATRAPTVAEARDLAAAVPAALRRIVSGIQQRQAGAAAQAGDLPGARPGPGDGGQGSPGGQGRADDLPRCLRTADPADPRTAALQGRLASR